MQDTKLIVVPKTGVLKFTADWCGPCRNIAPLIHNLSEEYAIDVTPVNVDEHTDLADEYNVSSIPVTVFIHESEEIGRVIGANSSEITKNFEALAEKIKSNKKKIKSQKNQIILPNCKEAELKNDRTYD